MVDLQNTPEGKQYSEFLSHFNNESDRGAALIAAALLDERLANILSNFLSDVPARPKLLQGFNAPLGTFSARISAAYALGLLQDNEYYEIETIRKIRNAFGHQWQDIDLNDAEISKICDKLPWLGPAEHECTSNRRDRFDAVVAVLLGDLLWRARLVAKEQRQTRIWPNRLRCTSSTEGTTQTYHLENPLDD